MLKAREIMTRDVISVGKDTPVRQAIKRMLDMQVAGMPVVAEDMSLAGIITEKDVLKLYGAADQGESKTVEDFMTSPAVCFEEDDTLEEICLCLIENDFRRVPVTSDGKVVGIISRPDVARRVLELIHQSAAAH
ncbi:MAG: CBS domain-containing protein [Planctomycetota bacterium]